MMTLTSGESRDHGPAKLRIKTAAGHLGWADGDGWPDVVIETHPRVLAKFIVRGLDGVIREVPAP